MILALGRRVGNDGNDVLALNVKEVLAHQAKGAKCLFERSVMELDGDEPVDEVPVENHIHPGHFSQGKEVRVW